ncbi:MAG: penicillin-binding protein 2 [Candidatus Omnitrophica bacterium]|nr:penicillin-binding protein 2 [Candidatus Omnitrophota bacterium]
MLSTSSKTRFVIVDLVILAVFPLIIYQLIRLTIQSHEVLVRFAEQQHNLVIEIEPQRGAILDRNAKEFATNLKVPSVYAVPRLISAQSKPALVNTLSKLLDLDRSFLEERLGRDKAFVWLKRRTSVREAEAIRRLENPHLGITYETKRFYPHREMLSNVIGFCNIDNVGQEGLELLYDQRLTGRLGYRYTKRDALGREMVALEKKLIPAVNGGRLILTIDRYIQFLTERSLDEAFRNHRAQSATAVVINPHTGEILAMASRPTFDPNHLGRSEIASRRNRAVTDIFEPGSAFKIVTATAALNEGEIALDDIFDCERGQWRVRPQRVIHDVHPYGHLTFPEVLIKSSNIGTVKIAKRLGEKPLYEYIKKFGFGERTGIDFPGEVSGILRPPEHWSKFSITSIPFGQEVAATAVQMLRAVSVIANGGRLVRPYLLKEIQDANGATLSIKEPIVSEPFLKPETVTSITSILERAVTEGTGKRAQIQGIRVAGKTGTSQKLDSKGGYSHKHFVGSFVGFAPAEHPMLAMIVSIDDPRPYYYGGTVAAPVFKEVIEQSLIYLGYVPKKVKKEEEKPKLTDQYISSLRTNEMSEAISSSGLLRRPAASSQ